MGNCGGCGYSETPVSDSFVASTTRQLYKINSRIREIDERTNHPRLCLALLIWILIITFFSYFLNSKIVQLQQLLKEQTRINGEFNKKLNSTMENNDKMILKVEFLFNKLDQYEQRNIQLTNKLNQYRDQQQRLNVTQKSKIKSKDLAIRLHRKKKIGEQMYQHNQLSLKIKMFKKYHNIVKQHQ